MRYLIASDIHGALKPVEKLVNIYHESKFDKVILLGDILYHGPRNDLPSSYAPKKVVELLNNTFNDYLWIQGNCDAEVDAMVLKHAYHKQKTLLINKKKVLFTHGHHLSRFAPYKRKKHVDVIIYGHYHVFDISLINDITYINVGSTSIPKDNKAQYAIIDDNIINIYDLDTNEIIGSYTL